MWCVCVCVCVRVCVLIKRKMGAEYEKHKPLKLVQTVPFFRLLLLKKKRARDDGSNQEKEKGNRREVDTSVPDLIAHSLVICSYHLRVGGLSGQLPD